MLDMAPEKRDVAFSQGSLLPLAADAACPLCHTQLV